jgi:hypothetical protein
MMHSSLQEKSRIPLHETVDDRVFFYHNKGVSSSHSIKKITIDSFLVTSDNSGENGIFAYI